ncbi:MAG: polysaccharide deacetylase family protein [Clostridia bacterium]|nr:polysaccharide deacetylase family protein [Clostridia bacterium]
MKKLTLKGVRIVSTIMMALLVVAVGAVCLLPERTVYISGGKTYAPIYSGNTEKAQVALMFNVYENTDIVNAIVDKLADNGVIATFFVGGCWADDNTETLKRIIAGGNELANHGYFHLDHKKLSEERNREEISCCHEVVKALTGYEMELFAPPSGAYGDVTLKCAASLGYKTIMWTVDTIDWRDGDVDVIVSRATKNVTSGALVLMHPKQHTLTALDEILAFYKEKGIACVTVSQCIAND